ncbi:Infection structure specific protein [Madurella fahalii]|uniref:Infection structure specific protein n=1 Tax=Madurella fahalii TaxID=1157608 RepID=A0ABQ0GPU4_9PEZI
MHSHVVIPLLVGVSLALANPAPMITAVPGHAFKPRQATVTASSTSLSELDDCASSFDAFISARPTQAPPLSEYLQSSFSSAQASASSSSWSDSVNIDNDCSENFEWRTTFAPPASIASDYTSFTNAWTSWAVSAQSEAKSLASKCADEGIIPANVLLAVMTNVEACKTALSVAYGLINAAELTTTDSPQSTQGDSGQNGNGGLTTTTSTGAAAESRETGYVAAAMAAAGVIGIMGLA